MLDPTATVLMRAWVTRTVIRSKAPSCENISKSVQFPLEEKKKNNTVVFIMDIKNQFQLSRPQIFQSIESSCPQALFHWSWPSLCVSPLTAATVCFSYPWVWMQSHGHNMSQEAVMSTQGRTQQTWWDLRYHRPKVRGQYSLMFFFKAVFQDFL